MKKALVLAVLSALVFSTHAQPAFTLEDITIHQKFEPKQLRGLNFLDENSWLILEHTDGMPRTSEVVKLRSDSFDREVLLNTGILSSVLEGDDFRVDSYQVLGEGSFLVSRGTKRIYRHSSEAFYYYIHLPTKNVIELFPGRKVKFPALSPDKSMAAYVLDNDLYVTDLKSGKITRLTFDGKHNHVINGGPDWVYEEEFSLKTGFQWSPDGKHIAYLKFDESEVKEFGMDFYLNNYPERMLFKYPRAGEQNSKVSVWLVDVKKLKSEQAPVVAEYIPRIKWRSDGALGIMTLNRFQNELDIHLYHPITKTLRTLYREVDKRYIDLPTCFEFMPDGELAISSEKSGFNQLYILDLEGREVYATKGDFDIAAVKQINMTDNMAYLQIKGPTAERKSVLRWDFLTDAMTYISDTTGTADVRILGNGGYIETFNSVDVRNRVTSKNERTGEARYLINDTRPEDSILGQRHFFDIPVNGVELHAWMTLPANFDSSKVYPVIFYVYGGPDHQTVLNQFPRSYVLWLNYMTQLGYITVSVDNRGSGARGSEFRKMTYTRLGKYEVEDQLAAAEWIGNLPFADAERMSIFGWSYGGYLSLISIMQEKKVFKAAISVAPVTNWRFYDSVYSERYLRTPVANPAGYDNMSPNKLVDQMQGHLLLVHGTADDNVHFQNSMELIKVMNEAGKRYQFLAYPNKDHGIGGAKTRLHLLNEMTDFLEGLMK